MHKRQKQILMEGCEKDVTSLQQPAGSNGNSVTIFTSSSARSPVKLSKDECNALRYAVGYVPFKF